MWVKNCDKTPYFRYINELSLIFLNFADSMVLFVLPVVVHNFCIFNGQSGDEGPADGRTGIFVFVEGGQGRQMCAISFGRPGTTTNKKSSLIY